MQWNAELEAVLRSNPDDEAAWSVLEDWTLERGDLRSRILERRNSRDEAGQYEAERDYRHHLLGPRHADYNRTFNCNWRAGYITACWLKGGATIDRAQILDEVITLRGAALLERVGADLHAPAELKMLPKLAGFPVRKLYLSSFWQPTLRVVFDASVLVKSLPLELLHLHGRAVTLPWRPQLAKLKSLSITPADPAELLELFERADALPELERLELFCRTMEFRHGVELAPFVRLLTGAATPKLVQLNIRDASEELKERLIQLLASSQLLPRLTTFSFEHGDARPEIPKAYRAAFAHLTWSR
jgi:hypothetical protein